RVRRHALFNFGWLNVSQFLAKHFPAYSYLWRYLFGLSGPRGREDFKWNGDFIIARYSERCIRSWLAKNARFSNYTFKITGKLRTDSRERCHPIEVVDNKIWVPKFCRQNGV